VEPQANVPSGCEACRVSGRREFVRGLAAVLAALVGLGATAAEAAAAPTWFGGAAERRGDEHRYPIPSADGAMIDSEQSVILARWQGSIYALSLACPHQNTALRWDASDARFQCPKHHSAFQPDGTRIEGRARRSMDRFAIRRDGNAALVDFDKLYQQDTDGNAWNAAVIRV